MNDWLYLLLLPAGFVCGFINVLAGSGSLITLPLLIFLGLPAGLANGTNRVAILCQNLVATHAFKRKSKLYLAGDKWLLIPVTAGALAGALLAVDLNERLMRAAIGAVMLVMLVMLVFDPARWLKAAPDQQAVRGPLLWIILFAAGAYGGFIQAGVGLVLLATLVFGAGHDLVRANALKVFLVLGFTPIALAVFVFNDQVRWDLGLLLAVGNVTGALVAVKLAIVRGASFVRWVLIIVIALAATKLIWDGLV